jgi:hypothetical protein
VTASIEGTGHRGAEPLVDSPDQKPGRAQAAQDLPGYRSLETPELRRFVSREAKPGRFLELLPDPLDKFV